MNDAAEQGICDIHVLEALNLKMVCLKKHPKRYSNCTMVTSISAHVTSTSRESARRRSQLSCVAVSSYFLCHQGKMACLDRHPKRIKPGCTRNVSCNASETALLVIDVQEYCSRPERGVFRETPRSALPYFFDRVDHEMVPNISQLLAAARRADVEIIYTVIEALTLDGRDLSLDYKLSGPLFVPKGHPDAAVLPDIRPDSDDIILPKTSCSVFCSTNINYVLRNLGTRYLIVCGQLTNQCVESAVRDAADLGFLVTVPEDACAAKSAAEHSSGLFNMRGFARVVSTAELRLELLKQVQDKQSLATVSSPPKRSICYLNVAYDELYGANVPGMMMEMFGDVGAGNFDLHTCNVKTDAFPVHDQFDGFIIMGSLSSCAASSKHDSWLPRLLGFLQLLVREERPLVGICFGHQAIALALGGTVIVNPAGTQRGLQSYPTTEDSRLRLDLPEECTSIFSHHGDAVVLLPKQAISWGYCHSGHWGMTLKKCLTTQAHPEFSTKTGLRALRALLEKDRKSISCQTGWVQGSPVEELDQQISLLDRPTDYKNFAVAFARVLGLLPETGRTLA